ncbi:MAG TPA: hypothetical protein VKA59_15855 [Vicinamibacterales bacterium]|nr:hypothetical protein [Vicinamibacterales bacterium]
MLQSGRDRLARSSIDLYTIPRIENVAERNSKGTSFRDTQRVLNACHPPSEDRRHPIGENRRSNFYRAHPRRSIWANIHNDGIRAANLAAVTVDHELVEEVAD